MSQISSTTPEFLRIQFNIYMYSVWWATFNIKVHSNYPLTIHLQWTITLLVEEHPILYHEWKVTIVCALKRNTSLHLVTIYAEMYNLVVSVNKKSLVFAPFVLFAYLQNNKKIIIMSTKTTHHTCSSSSGLKSFLILNVFLISSGVLPAEQVEHYNYA